MPDPLIGRVVNGRFKIVSVIARGGMGKVYRAEQAPLGRICALKVLSPKYEGDRDPEFHKRFFLEASTASKLSHPNTVTVFDYGHTDDDIYYIAMEYIEGKTLHRVLREEHAFSEARTSHIARQICRSLREAHSIGVVHRDLKPGNVLLVDHEDEHDHVKVLDFGLVKDTESGEDLTQQGLFMGSPKYMAPEQITGGEVSARTDIYSLGVMMYEMIAGKVPFDKGASVGTLMAHVHDPVPPLSAYNPDVVLSAAMETIILRCLDKDPSRRFGSMNELLAALKRTGTEGSLTDTNESLPAVVGPMSGRPSRPSVSGITGISGEYSAVSTSAPVSAPGTITYSGPIATDTSMRPPGAAPVFVAPPITDSMGPRPQPPPESLAPVDPGRGHGRRMAWAFAGGLAVAVGVAAVLLSRPGPAPAGAGPADTGAQATPPAVPSPASTATPAPVAGTASPATTPAATNAAPASHILHVDSTPPGATVLEGNKELCAATPCEITWTGEAAAPSASHELTFEKKGFKPAKISVSGTEPKVRAKLDFAPARSGGSKLDGFKTNPY